MENAEMRISREIRHVEHVVLKPNAYFSKDTTHETWGNAYFSSNTTPWARVSKRHAYFSISRIL